MTDNCIYSPTLDENLLLTRSKRKTLAIIINSGNIEIKSPLKYPICGIHDYIDAKKNWIEKHLHDQRVKLKERLIIAEGKLVPFFGINRTIVVIISNKQSVEAEDSRLIIYSKRNSPDHLEKLFNRWLMNQAREYMNTQTIRTARALGVEDRLKEIVFRKTRTKWGHCMHDGTIQYNWLVMMAPRQVIDYLIAHESSHLLHMNHSKRFWQTVKKVCPQYDELKHWLRDNGHRFWSTP